MQLTFFEEANGLEDCAPRTRLFLPFLLLEEEIKHLIHLHRLSEEAKPARCVLGTPNPPNLVQAFSAGMATAQPSEKPLTKHGSIPVHII